MSVDPYGRPEHTYGILFALSEHYQKLLQKKMLATFHDLKSPWHVSCGSMFERVSNGFHPKEAHFNFLLFTYNGEAATLT